MIFGVGTDLVEVSRIQESLQRFGHDFASRILGEFELQEFTQSQQQAPWLIFKLPTTTWASQCLIWRLN